MNVDPFTGQLIHHHGVWTQTNCLAREQAIMLDIVKMVEHKGYRQSDTNRRMWTKGHRKIIVCLVDDLRSASQDYETDTPYLWDSNTLVITDNYIACPTLYEVLSVPKSFFGIYHHAGDQSWQPDRSFCFSVNRLDDRRLRLMLELAKRAHLSEGYINFNCQTEYLPDSIIPDHAQLKANFDAAFGRLSDQDAEKYQWSFNLLSGIVPYRNYDCEHEQIHVRSRCNIVVESYGSDNTVAFSEKIFRALLVPSPWTLYGGHYAVAYLESLGFDCLRDVINHNHYDQLKEIEDKAHVFIWFSLKFAREADQSWLAERCRKAAWQNQQLLNHFREQWPEDWSRWLSQLEDRLSNL